MDAPLRKALDMVKVMQAASAEERRAFVKNPRSAFAEALGEEANSGAIHGLFVETQQYADWVNGVGLWKPKILPLAPAVLDELVAGKIRLHGRWKEHRDSARQAR